MNHVEADGKLFTLWVQREPEEMQRCLARRECEQNHFFHDIDPRTRCCKRCGLPQIVLDYEGPKR